MPFSQIHSITGLDRSHRSPGLLLLNAPRVDKATYPTPPTAPSTNPMSTVPNGPKYYTSYPINKTDSTSHQFKVFDNNGAQPLNRNHGSRWYYTKTEMVEDRGYWSEKLHECKDPGYTSKQGPVFWEGAGIDPCQSSEPASSQCGLTLTDQRIPAVRNAEVGL